MSRALACLAILLLLPLPARAETRAIMILPFTGEGIHEDVLNGLQAIFVDETRKIPRVKVPELTARTLMIIDECAGDPQCLGTGLSRMGATEFVFTQVSKPEAGGFELRQSLHEAPSGHIVRDSVQVVRGRSPQLEELTYRAAARLIAPTLLRGGIQVDVNVGGADIFIDGKRMGRSPQVAPFGGITEGKHTVRVEKDGYAPFEDSVKVTFDEVSGLDVRLTRDVTAKDYSKPTAATRPFPMIPVIVAAVGAGVTVGVVGVLVVLGAGLLGGTMYAAQVITTRAQNGQLYFPQDEPMLRIWQGLAGSTVASFIAAGVAGVVALGGTVAGTVGALVWHFTRPLPEANDLDFKTRTVNRDGDRPRPRAKATEPDITLDIPEPTPPPARKSEEMTEDTLPEGE